MQTCWSCCYIRLEKKMHAHINILSEVQQHIGSENRNKLLTTYDIIQTFKWTAV